VIFWDSSALVALLVDEGESSLRLQQLQSDPDLAVWWATPVECESAIQRRLRDGSITIEQARVSRRRLEDLSAAWHEVSPIPAIGTLARRLLRTHPLRTADSLQLAAALAIYQAGVAGLRFACADSRLLIAAEAEGFIVI